MFTVDKTKGTITMHRGDTGAYKVRASRKSGTAFTANDRMLFTVKAGDEIKIQRFYRLDTDLGNGVTVIQFHNNDTDTWADGTYSMERRYIVEPRWEGGEAPDGDVVNALTAGVRICEGDIVRTPLIGQGSITIQHVIGEV